MQETTAISAAPSIFDDWKREVQAKRELVPNPEAYDYLNGCPERPGLLAEFVASRHLRHREHSTPDATASDGTAPRAPDKAYSLCDAVSFVLMKQRNITDALTTDHHFEQEGFRKLLG